MDGNGNNSMPIGKIIVHQINLQKIIQDENLRESDKKAVILKLLDLSVGDREVGRILP